MQIAQTRRHRSWCCGITMARVSLKQHSFSFLEKQTTFVEIKSKTKQPDLGEKLFPVLSFYSFKSI